MATWRLVHTPHGVECDYVCARVHVCDYWLKYPFMDISEPTKHALPLYMNFATISAMWNFFFLFMCR